MVNWSLERRKMNPLLDFHDKAKAKFSKWGPNFTYMHWCDLINLDPNKTIDGGVVLGNLDGKVILLFFTSNRLMNVYAVDTGDFDTTVISIAATLKILAEQPKAKGLSSSLTASARAVAEVTGVKFDKVDTIKNLVMAPVQPHLMLNTYSTIFTDEATRNENLRVKTTATSKRNYRREMLRHLNPIIKEVDMRFVTLEYRNPTTRFNSEQILSVKVQDSTTLNPKKKSYIHLFTFDTVRDVVKVWKNSPLFSNVYRVDKIEFTYKEFAELLVEARNAITSWLVVNSIEPTEKKINTAFLLLGSMLNREDFILRPHLTEPEVVVFLQNDFTLEQVFRSVTLNIPAKDLANFKDAPDEWVDDLVDDDENETIIHFGNLLMYYSGNV